MDEVYFDDCELNSTGIRKIEEFVDYEIEAMRKKNDGDFDSIATAQIRGQIRAFKRIKALLERSHKEQPPLDQRIKPVTTLVAAGRS